MLRDKLKKQNKKKKQKLAVTIVKHRKGEVYLEGASVNETRAYGVYLFIVGVCCLLINDISNNDINKTHRIAVLIHMHVLNNKACFCHVIIKIRKDE